MVTALLLVGSLIATDEPVLCTDLDMSQVSVIEGRVERRTVRREQPFGWSPFRDVQYEVIATVRPVRVLRGAPVRRAVTVRLACSTPWMDLTGRRFCSDLLKLNEIDTFQVDRRTHEATRDPHRDEVSDYDRRMSRPLPRCERQ